MGWHAEQSEVENTGNAVKMPYNGTQPYGHLVRQPRYRPLAEQGHVTVTIIKIDGSTKWLPEIERAS